MKRGEAVWILLVAFLLRVGAGLYTGHFQDPYPWEYEWIADNLLQGKGYVCSYMGTPYRALCMPGYPVFCASLYAVTGHSQILLLILQCLLSAFLCLQIQAVGRRVFPDRTVGFLAAWAVALHPGLILYATRLHSLTFDVLTYTAALWTWLLLAEQPTRRRALWAGLANGAAILFRGTILPFVPFAMAWFLWTATVPMRIKLKRLGLIALLIGTLLGPWLLRNAVVFHRFPLFITSSDYVLWIGNNPVSRGSALLPDGRTVLEAAPERLRAKLEQLDETGQSRLFRAEVMEFLRSSPGAALRLYGKKLLSFFWFSDRTGMLYPAAYTHGYRWYYAAMAGLALWGLFSVRRRITQPAIMLLLGFIASIALYQSLYYVEGRHRWTVEPVLLLFAAQGALTTARWMTRSSR